MSLLRDGSSTASSKRMRRALWVLSLLAVATAGAPARADAPPAAQTAEDVVETIGQCIKHGDDCLIAS